MGLSFNSSLKPEEHKKIGRNELCSCGSGKKFKKCCLQKQNEQQYSAGNKQGKVARVVDWVTQQPWNEWYLQAYFKRYYPNLTMEESEMSAIMDLAIFEGLVGSKTPLEMFVSQATLTTSERNYYQSWTDNHIFSFFKVQEVDLGQSVVLKDLLSKLGKTYFVLEKQGTYTMSVGTVVAARLVSHYDDWMMSGGALFALPSEFTHLLQKNRDKLPSEGITQQEFMESSLPQFDHIDKDSLVENGYTLDEVEKALSLLGEELDVVEVLQRCKPVAMGTSVVNDKQLNSSELYKNDLQEIIFKCDSQHQINRLFSLLKRLGDLTVPDSFDSNVSKQIQVGKAEVEKFEFKTNFADSHEGLSSKQIKIYNKAASNLLNKKPLLALKQFAQLTSVVESIDESFRWYGNVGTCLSMLGQLKLAESFFKKAVRINSNYDVAKNNLKNFDDDKIKDQLINQGSIYFWSMFHRTKWALNLADSVSSKLLQKSNPSLLQDMIVFLSYFEDNKVSLTPKRKDIPLKTVKVINKLFVVPDSETMSYKFSKESEFSQLRLLRMVALFTGWVKITTTGRKTSRPILSITNKGKEWLKKPALDQFSMLLTAWWGDTAWEEVYDFHNLATGFIEQSLGFYQDSLFVCLRSLYWANGWLSLEKVMGSFSSTADEFEIFLSSSMFERDVLIFLTKAGLVKPKYQDLVFVRGEISFDDDPDDKREQAYKMTALGRQVFVVLEERLRGMVPKEILQMEL